MCGSASEKKYIKDGVTNNVPYKEKEKKDINIKLSYFMYTGNEDHEETFFHLLIYIFSNSVVLSQG